VGIGEGHIDAVGSVAWGQRTGAICCSGSNDQSIKVWNTAKLADGCKKGLLGRAAGEPAAVAAMRGWKAHDKDINSVALSPNEALVASGSQDRTVKIWHVETGALAVTCKGHKRGVWCVKFSPVDKVVGSASADATVKLWAATDGACLKTFEGHEGSGASSLSSSPSTAPSRACVSCCPSTLLPLVPLPLPEHVPHDSLNRH
jgi:U3 small nucleolar RNA-associated protein 13